MRAKWPLALLLGTVVGGLGCGSESNALPVVDAAAQTGGQNGGIPGIGTVVRMLPDGGLASLLGDGGLSALVCGSQVRLGESCPADTLPCVLSSLGGVCACVSGTYLCPTNTTSGPKPCPATVASGTSCTSPLSICIATNTACLCGLGTYACL